MRLSVLAQAALLVVSAVATSSKDDLVKAPQKMVDMVTDGAIRSHVRFLGDPLLEGRRAGLRGERLAGKYIASVLESLGVQPYGENGTFFQDVPLRSVEPTSLGPITVTSGAATTTLAWGDDYVASTQSSKSSIAFENDEIVYVGYGISSTALGWDDYKGVDVTGKVVMALLGTPSSISTSASSALLGRATTKISTATAHGAKGLITVATLTSTGYTWAAMVGREGNTLLRSGWEMDSNPIDFYAYVNESDANTWLAMYGRSLTNVTNEAASSNFVPFSLGTISLAATFTHSTVTGKNIIGILPGSKHPNEAIVYSSHVDHLGIGLINKQVYPGANDNALGCSINLAIATALSRYTEMSENPMRRSVIFFFPTAEEFGLYGSQYWVKSVITKNEIKLLGNINYDMGSTLPKTHDVIMFGRTEDSLAAEVADFAAELEDTEAVADYSPSSGYFARSDHYVFYSYNISVVWPFLGRKTIGYENYTTTAGVVDPTAVGLRNWNVYYVTTYHTVNDKYLDTWNLAGTIQLARVGLRMGYAVAAGKYVPYMF